MDGLLSQSRVLNSSIFGAGGAGIKSVQLINYNFLSTEASKDITITSIDTTKSIAIISGKGDNLYKCDDITSVQILNSTTVRLIRGRANGANTVAFVQVIEFYSVKSKQSGTFNLTTTAEQTLAITSVDIEKSMLIASWYTTNTDQLLLYTMSRVVDASTLAFSQNSNSSTFIDWQVIEFH